MVTSGILPIEFRCVVILSVNAENALENETLAMLGANEIPQACRPPSSCVCRCRLDHYYKVKSIWLGSPDYLYD